MAEIRRKPGEAGRLFFCFQAVACSAGLLFPAVAQFGVFAGALIKALLNSLPNDVSVRHALKGALAVAVKYHEV